ICSLCAQLIGGDHPRRPPRLRVLDSHDPVAAMQFAVPIANGNAAGLDIARVAIMRRTAICKSLSASIGHKAATLITETAQNVPHALRGPLRKWNARAG